MSSPRPPPSQTTQFLTELTDQLHLFYAPNTQLQDRIRNFTKHLYDTEKQWQPEDMLPHGLETLFVDGFDDEQIWSQIQEFHAPLLQSIKGRMEYFSAKDADDRDGWQLVEPSSLARVAHLDTEEDSSLSPSSYSSGDEEEESEEDDESSAVESSDEDGDGDDEEPEEDIEGYMKGMERHVEELDEMDQLDEEVFHELYGDEMGDDVEEDAKSRHNDFYVGADGHSRRSNSSSDKVQMKKKGKSVSFALPEPEDDGEEEQLRKLLDDIYERENDESDEEIMEYDEDDEDLEDEEEDNDEDDGGLFLDDGRLNPNLNLAKINAAGNKRNGDNDTENRLSMLDEDEDDYYSGEDESQSKDNLEDNDEEESRPKTAFELHQEQLLSQMEHLEDENIKLKPWQESGEASKWQRPQNSLLEEDLVFQHAFKSKPIITEEMTRDLESIIVHRIVTSVFDDPVRPEADEPDQLRKDVELKHEQSKKSLAQIYEEEYMKRVEGVEADDVEEENEDVKRVKEDLLFKVASTLRTLNMMSSFNYISPPVQPSASNTRNKATPAISMEEKTPIAVSEETLQAPEEIMKPMRTLPTGDNERTSQERQHKRRKAKGKATRKAKKAKLLVEQLNPGQASEKHKDSLVKDLVRKQERVQANRSEDTNKYTNSKAFFNILQENLQKYGTNTKASSKTKNFQDTEEADRRRKMVAKKL